MTSTTRLSPTLSDIEFGYTRERTPIVEEDDDDEIVWPMRNSDDSSASSSPAPTEAVCVPNHKPVLQMPGHRRAATVAQHQFTISDDNNTIHSFTEDNSTQSIAINAADLYNFDLVDFELVRGDGGEREYVPPNERVRPQARVRGHRKTQSDSTLAFPRGAPVMGSPPPNQLQQPALKPGTKVKGKPRPEPLQPLLEMWADDVEGLAAPMERLRVSSSPTRQRRSEQGKTRGARKPNAKTGAAPEATTSVAKTGSKTRPQKGSKRPKGGTRTKSGEKEGNITPANSYPSPEPSRTPSPVTGSPEPASAVVKRAAQKKEKPRRAKSNRASAKLKEAPPHEVPSPAPSTPCGLGARSVVDDVSENGDTIVLSTGGPMSDRDHLLGMAYEESVKFMNAFIEHPDYYTSRASRLTFLQALIVELGLVSTDGPAAGSLPGTLTGAKALLKSHAFLNVHDYLEMRAQGVDALRGAMKSNRGALVRELRGRRRGDEKRVRRAPLGWVKETGLTVLLVTL